MVQYEREGKPPRWMKIFSPYVSGPGPTIQTISPH